jgi:PAS domain S-box-containing protein
MIVHQEGKIVFINEAGVKLWGGASSADFVGQSILDRVAPQYHALVVERVKQAKGGMTTPVVEQVHRTLEGGTVRVEVTGMPCMFDGKPGVLAILRDVTQLRQHQEILHKFFDYVPLIVGIIGADGRVLQVNSQWQRLLGPATELTLADVLESCYPDPVDRHRVEEAIRTMPSGWVDSRVRVRDGRTLDMSTAIVSLSDGTRIGIAKDITDRKRYEDELRRHKAELEQRVAQRTEELVQKNLELQKEIAVRLKAETALNEKKQILEDMLDMHERYRQLLAYEIHDTFVQDVVAGLMYLDVFFETHADAGDENLAHLQKGRELLLKSIDGARRMISGLRPPIIDERGVVAAIEYLASELNAEGMDVRLEHDVHIARLPGVLESTIYRIVQEALTNVRRHSGSNLAQVRLTQRDNMLRLEVRDFGIGFDVQTVSKGRFGLRGIAERTQLVGGTLSIKSAPGKGTEIVVELPMDLETHGAAEPGPATLESRP